MGIAKIMFRGGRWMVAVRGLWYSHHATLSEACDCAIERMKFERRRYNAQ